MLMGAKRKGNSDPFDQDFGIFIYRIEEPLVLLVYQVLFSEKDPTLFPYEIKLKFQHQALKTIESVEPEIPGLQIGEYEFEDYLEQDGCLEN